MHNSILRNGADSNFHYVGDGRGRRNIFINGNKIKNCIWADIERGIAVFCPNPFRAHKTKRDEVYSRKIRGKIIIEFI